MTAGSIMLVHMMGGELTGSQEIYFDYMILFYISITWWPAWYSVRVKDEFVFGASNVTRKKIIAVFLMTYEMKQQKSLDVANCKFEGFIQLDPL